MSDPVDANGNNAPLPWLGRSAVSQGKQAWSASGDTLVVQYPFVRRDFYRQIFANYKRMWWLFAFMGVFVASMLFVMYFLPPSRTKLSPIPGLLIVLEIPVIMSLMTWLIATISEKSMRGRLHQVTLSAAGICKSIEPIKWGEVQIVTPWMNVKQISESREDTLIVPRLGITAVPFPNSAFDDADAARRFRDAAIALWQTGGNMDAVPESVRAEFAPQPEPSETV